MVIILGCELTWFILGILKGNTAMERIANPLSVIKLMWFGIRNNPLNKFLTEANTAVREVFHDQVTYAASPIEKVDWSIFDFVSLDYYRDTRNKKNYGKQLQRHFDFGKPVVITKFGLCTFRAA